MFGSARVRILRDTGMISTTLKARALRLVPKSLDDCLSSKLISRGPAQTMGDQKHRFVTCTSKAPNPASVIVHSLDNNDSSDQNLTMLERLAFP